tara:strand:- start:200 stop:904 length:705 start_codon:yes stop_codon:yes gene_type:complete
MENILCVIPARSGSEEIKNKNIKTFVDRPLIAHAIEYARSCKLITKTIISTDSNKYAEIARKHGGEVPFIRPKKYSGPTSQDIDFMQHALINCEKIYQLKFHIIVLLRATSPVRPKNLIERGIKMIKDDPSASSLRAVTISHQHPYRHFTFDGQYIEGYEKSVYEPYNLPRQSWPKSYYSAGDLEVVRRETLLGGSVSGKKIIPLILEDEEVVDIDSHKDWKLAESKFKKRSEL